MFVSHLPDFLARLDLSRAAKAMGDTAVACVRETMLTSYEQPVYQSGALYRDVSCTCHGITAVIGNTLPYAAAVHDGTLHTPPRPYLAEGILRSADALKSAAAHALL